MAILNCQQCGGILDVDLEQETVAICPFCGSRQTIYDLQEKDYCTDVALLLERAVLLIEDQEFFRADEYCERALNQDPQNAQAYLFKLLIDHRAQKIEDLSDEGLPFDNNVNYQKYLRFGDPEVCEILREYNRNIRYSRACAAMNAEMEDAYLKAEKQFRALAGYKDSDALADQCAFLAAEVRKENTYDNAMIRMQSSVLDEIAAAERMFSSIPGYKDSDDRKEECRILMDRIRAERIQAEKALLEFREKRRKRIIVSVLLCVVALLILFLVYVTVRYLIPAIRYGNAVSSLQAGDLVSAYRVFSDLDDYRDAEEQYLKLQSEIPFATVLSCAAPGDYIFFGSYEQDNSKANGKEPIEWLVLAAEDGRILLISKYVLCATSYHNREEVVTWENSSLRNWLNASFYDTAFSKKEENYIQTVTLTNPDHPESGINGGKNTEDAVFLLSFEEVESYFPTLKDMMAEPTAYAIENGVHLSAEYGTSWWWLRSPGKSSFHGIHVYTNGGIAYDEGFLYRVPEGGVRPALWLTVPADSE